jgi:hypothetical protein
MKDLNALPIIAKVVEAKSFSAAVGVGQADVHVRSVRCRQERSRHSIRAASTALSMRMMAV